MSSSSSPVVNSACFVCSRWVSTGQGQAIFTAECSHSFHLTCIVRRGKPDCPVCFAKWNDFSLTKPEPNPNPNNYTPFVFPTFPTPQFPRFTQPPATSEPPEHLQFSDDEPLLDPMSCDSILGLQKVTIKTIPELPAIAASQSVSNFAVLVSLKAPSLSDDARQSQRAPIDLVTVLDVSGSMHGSKLALLKHAMNFVVDNLGPSDRLSIVSFSDQARRVLPLRRMTEIGREDAKRAVGSLYANGGTNIVQGLTKGVRVLEERRHYNPVASFIFLSDGNDTCNSPLLNFSNPIGRQQSPQYLHLLPPAIRPSDGGTTKDASWQRIFPVHSFGFGSDHDPIAMHAISDASGGTFSFIESYEMIQDAFASCIGGLLSVVTQELRVSVRSASHGVEIKSIPSGRYASGITNEGSQGTINIGELYADEEKEFLINLSITTLPDDKNDEKNDRKTSLLDITCSYIDVVSRKTVEIESDLVKIKRPETLSLEDTVVNIEVDRQRNRLRAAESIAEAQKMAETGNLTGAQALLSTGRLNIFGSASAQAGDGLSTWLQDDMKETERRFESQQMYQQQGRAFALSGMNSHAMQRATTKGNMVAGAPAAFGSSGGGGGSTPFGCYATPQMANMVNKSQQQLKKPHE